MFLNFFLNVDNLLLEVIKSSSRVVFDVQIKSVNIGQNRNWNFPEARNRKEEQLLWTISFLMSLVRFVDEYDKNKEEGLDAVPEREVSNVLEILMKIFGT